MTSISHRFQINIDSTLISQCFQIDLNLSVSVSIIIIIIGIITMIIIRSHFGFSKSKRNKF